METTTNHSAADTAYSKYIRTQLDETYALRVSKLSAQSRFLLTLSSTLLTILLPLSLFSQLAPLCRILLGVAVLSLLVSALGGLTALQYEIKMESDKLNSLLRAKLLFEQTGERQNCILGGNIKVLIYASTIAAIGFLVALCALLATLLHILFA